MSSVESKRCTKCHQTQPASEFHRNRARADGLAVWCKSCRTYDRFYDLERHRRYRTHLRMQFLTAYGTTCVGTADRVACVNSESRLEALTIGHHFNDGAAHKERLGNKSSAGVIVDLKGRGWPKDEGIVTQCANCQLVDQRRDRGR